MNAECGTHFPSSFSIQHSSLSIPMSSAQVRSTEAIEALQTALARFNQRVQNALDALDAELHRTSDWVEHDRPSHWRTETHRAEDAVHQAKIELERCLTFSATGERPACREQKAALEKSKARLTYCREKAEAVKHWQRSFRHESFEYDGRIGQLRRMIENDVPRARGVLAKIVRRLDEYQIEQAPISLDASAEPLPPVPLPPASPSAKPSGESDS
jgi:hypothetical protein